MKPVMNPVVPDSVLGSIFALAPLILGVGVTFAYWLAKRNEGVTVPGTLGTTYACANCGKRGTKEHMVPQTHDGAVSYYCSHCAK
jgi:DNA-directed RNA polymerase subunit RPC12/RpoP